MRNGAAGHVQFQRHLLGRVASRRTRLLAVRDRRHVEHAESLRRHRIERDVVAIGLVSSARGSAAANPCAPAASARCCTPSCPCRSCRRIGVARRGHAEAATRTHVRARRRRRQLGRPPAHSLHWAGTAASRRSRRSTDVRASRMPARRRTRFSSDVMTRYSRSRSMSTLYRRRFMPSSITYHSTQLPSGDRILLEAREKPGLHRIVRIRRPGARAGPTASISTTARPCSSSLRPNVRSFGIHVRREDAEQIVRAHHAIERVNQRLADAMRALDRGVRRVEVHDEHAVVRIGRPAPASRAGCWDRGARPPSAPVPRARTRLLRSAAACCLRAAQSPPRSGLRRSGRPAADRCRP